MSPTSSIGLAYTRSQVAHSTSRLCMYSGNLREANANSPSAAGSMRAGATSRPAPAPQTGQARSVKRELHR